MRAFRSYIFLLVFCISVSGCDAKEVTLLERYPGPWIEETNVPITKLLIQKDVKGCGFLKYRASSQDNEEYLVYCSRDGENWNAYIVWPRIGKLIGPNAPDPSIPVK